MVQKRPLCFLVKFFHDLINPMVDARSITETKNFRRIAVREQWVVLNGSTMSEISKFCPKMMRVVLYEITEIWFDMPIKVISWLEMEKIVFSFWTIFENSIIVWRLESFFSFLFFKTNFPVSNQCDYSHWTIYFRIAA